VDELPASGRLSTVVFNIRAARYVTALDEEKADITDSSKSGSNA
jgi:hypothetical protein